jgi:hypothetical protein
LQGGVHGLASAVRMHLPSASSAPLKWAQSDAPSAHPALESPLCARDAALFCSCSSSTNSFPETGFVEDLELSSAEVSTKPDPDGRLVRRLQTRQTADLRLFCEETSDLHVPRAGPRPAACSACRQIGLRTWSQRPRRGRSTTPTRRGRICCCVRPAATRLPSVHGR